MIPTKLPHYIFPAYATLSILVSKEIIMRKFSPNLLNYSLLPAIIFPLTILSIITFAIYEYSSFDTEFFFIIIILLFLLFYLIYFLKKKSKKILILASIHQAFIYLVAVYYLVPKLDSFWIAKI